MGKKAVGGRGKLVTTKINNGNEENKAGKTSLYAITSTGLKSKAIGRLVGNSNGTLREKAIEWRKRVINS